MVFMVVIILGNIRPGVLDITRAINTKARRGRGHHELRVVGWVGSKFNGSNRVREAHQTIQLKKIMLAIRNFISPNSNIRLVYSGSV